jgi:hypothetical protein
MPPFRTIILVTAPTTRCGRGYTVALRPILAAPWTRFMAHLIGPAFPMTPATLAGGFAGIRRLGEFTFTIRRLRAFGETGAGIAGLMLALLHDGTYYLADIGRCRKLPSCRQKKRREREFFVCFQVDTGR